MILFALIGGMFLLLIIRRVRRKAAVDEMLARPYRYPVETRRSRYIRRQGL